MILILIFTLELLPGPDHLLRNMLHNISCVALILSLIISKQRVCSSVSPPLTEKAPLFVYSPLAMLNN
jgi:hypothetical protein